MSSARIMPPRGRTAGIWKMGADVTLRSDQSQYGYKTYDARVGTAFATYSIFDSVADLYRAREQSGFDVEGPYINGDEGGECIFIHWIGEENAMHGEDVSPQDAAALIQYFRNMNLPTYADFTNAELKDLFERRLRATSTWKMADWLDTDKPPEIRYLDYRDLPTDLARAHYEKGWSDVEGQRDVRTPVMHWPEDNLWVVGKPGWTHGDIYEASGAQQWGFEHALHAGDPEYDVPPRWNVQEDSTLDRMFNPDSDDLAEMERDPDYQGLLPYRDKYLQKTTPVLKQIADVPLYRGTQKIAGLWEQPSPFQMPHSVEQAFVRAMECPQCHSNLLLDQPPPKSSEKVYCPVCGWKPRESSWKISRHVDVEIRKEDHFYPQVEGVTMEQLAALGVEPQIYNAYDGDEPVGSVVFFKLEDRRLLSLVPDAPDEPVMWVEWIWVPEDYRDSDVFQQLAVIVKQAAENLPIEAYYRNERLKRVIDRYFQRGGAFDSLPSVNPVSYQFTPFTDYENEMYDALDNGTKAAYRRRARNVNRRVQRLPGSTGTVTGKQLWMLQNRWGGKCAYCGQNGADSWDHVAPLGQGGENSIENLLPCHIACNRELNDWQNRNQDYTIRDPHPDWLTVPATDPLQAHQSAPKGTRQRIWSLVSAWKRIEPHDELRNVAQSYMDNKGWKYKPPRDYPDVDSERAARIAQEYEAMEHNPNDPRVQAAYDALIRETDDQYRHLLDNGYSMEFEPEGGAYASPWDSMHDVRDNKHLYVYPTSAGFGAPADLSNHDHPLLQDSGYRWNDQPVTYNDLFRGVHDVFGHAKEGVGFRHDGEENAWRQHSAMFSEPARHALTSETRGQNSWVNFGPYGEHNQTADQESTVYAPQKAGLMPEWATWEGASDTYG